MTSLTWFFQQMHSMSCNDIVKKKLLGTVQSLACAEQKTHSLLWHVSSGKCACV